MRHLLLLTAFFTYAVAIQAQLYFPPNDSSDWETINPLDLGYCQSKIDSLYDYLDTNNTKAFIMLKDGKIVLEEYFNGHSSTSNWYWASAGKTLTAFVVGLAQQENYLRISDTTSTYLGQGWTNSTLAQEEKITIWHQLTMTSGLDDGVTDPYCTDSSCLQYISDAGTRWAYHNAPYTLLDQVIENSTGLTLNSYTDEKVKIPTGMDGFFLQQGYNNLYVSTARSMARFGLLILNNGNWNGNQLMTDTGYFDEMVNTSQDLNESYGYLWWLNGKNSYMIPQTQTVFNGSLNPNAPSDMIAALGKNGQLINIVPSENLVFIRMGDTPDGSLVPFLFNDSIWEYINELECPILGTAYSERNETHLVVYPNPANDLIWIDDKTNINFSSYRVLDNSGRTVLTGEYGRSVDISQLSQGVYFLQILGEDTIKVIQFIKE